MQETSVSLLERLRQPANPRDWDRLVELYTPLLLTWARRAGLQDADAADLTQEVFAHLHRKLPGFEYDPSRSFRSWLRTVTLNLWRARQRKSSARMETAALDNVPEPELADPAADYWEADFNRHLARRALEIMKEEFQPSTWMAFWKVVVDGNKPEDVAKELGISPGAVYAARHRVKTRLKEELAGLMDEFD
jgi:RNA polymerase sigma-70 factor (ECF subfamily)